jgi:hypothetical protein
VFEGFAEDFDFFLGGVVCLDAGEDADALEHAADCFGDDVGGVGGCAAVDDCGTLVGGCGGDGGEDEWVGV